MQRGAIVIGGGAVGASVAIYLRGIFDSVLLLEREAGLLRRASYANQARVHNGYHYPRSFLTALRSRVNFPKFVEEYRECIDDSFEKYYAIARHYSQVSASQFVTFCKRIGAPVEPAPKHARALFNPALVEDVFLVQEYAFDAHCLATRLTADLRDCGVDVLLNATVRRLEQRVDGAIAVSFEHGGQATTAEGRFVFNCTYSGINEILEASGLPLIPLKHETTEMALLDVPEVLRNVGVTVMCGPFFSLMPFPARRLHTLSHVRYTPHTWWEEGGRVLPRPAAPSTPAPPALKTSYLRMLRDAERYIPALRDAGHVDSLWETKTVLPSSEADDSRPILFRRDHGMQNLTCIMGGKIDNIYDVLAELQYLREMGSLA